MAHSVARKKIAQPSRISGIAEIAERYDGFIIDLWGVIHNGIEPCPGAVNTLTYLRRQNSTVCLLSNSPRRGQDVARKLETIGIGPQHYQHLITSGDATLKLLSDTEDPITVKLGPSYFHIGPEDGFGLLKDIEQIASQNPETASFVLVTGTSDGRSIGDYEAPLSICAAMELPMLCANPDLVVRTATTLTPCAGSLAKRYEDLGGKVFYCGKPHLPTYRTCFRDLGLMPWSVLAVGDSLATDVAGANAAGIDVAFITSGIHLEDFSVKWGEEAPSAALADLLDAAGHHPDFVLSRFIK